jgi:ribosomal protein S18 acetylase RimI-like enzyme
MGVRQGIGQALVETARRRFAQRQIRRVEVRVAVANERSLPFWRTMGFIPYLETMYAELPASPQRS